ncbi:MAG TPA: MFS transporter [Candidatus Dormibacteraeota bacterium]|jgi:EmrB/QacA subfamily drug resistance transporter
MARRSQVLWTFAITSIGLFMVTLDNLVVTTALPVIRRDLHANLQQLEWTVNAYTLTFAVLLLTGAALGDRFGRRRVFSLGIALFTIGSAASALAQSPTTLIIARAVQGGGAAMVTPLTLTILSAAVSKERRGVALGAWGGIGGLAVAVGPIVGGAIVQGISWQWIFWLNVPIGLALAPLARIRLVESRGADGQLDLGGLLIASAGLFAIVWGLVRANQQGWTSPEIVGTLAGGAALVVAFVIYELRSRAPMLPIRYFRNATFSGANAASLFMFFGMFGSVFLLAQFFQTVQGLSPLDAGLRILPWTAMPILVAPTAGALSDRINGRTLMAIGLALQGIGLLWIGHVTSPAAPYSDFIVPFILSGVGMGMFFAPVANVVLSSVSAREEGKASGANNAIRELGGVLGVTVLASIFAHWGGYTSGASFVAGLTPAITVGGAVVLAGAVVAALIPARRRALASETASVEEPAAA